MPPEEYATHELADAVLGHSSSRKGFCRVIREARSRVKSAVTGHLLNEDTQRKRAFFETKESLKREIVVTACCWKMSKRPWKLCRNQVLAISQPNSKNAKAPEGAGTDLGRLLI